MKNDLLNGFRLGRMERHLNIYGVEVRQHGEIIAKCQWRQEFREHVWSVSKSFTSMGLGFALEEGLISLDDKIAAFFPEELPEHPSDWLLDLTVQQAMTMSMGQEVCPTQKLRQDCMSDWIPYILAQPIVYKPGTRFYYTNAPGYLVSAIIQRKTGLTLRDYLVPRLFEPLHIFNPQWDTCPQGITLGSIGLHLTTSELSRFGQMLLDGGRFEGRQVVPEDYVRLATSKLIENAGSNPDPEWGAGYGLQFWQNTVPNSFRADGLYGQYIVVLPEYDAVVTVKSHIENRSQHDVLRLIWDELLPALEAGK